MSPEQPHKRRGIASRMGRWSAQHRTIAIFGWLAFVAGSFVLGMQIGTTNINTDTANPRESGRMFAIIQTEFKQPTGESVLVHSDRLTTDDPAFVAAVQAEQSALRKQPDVMNIRSPLGNNAQIGQDGHAGSGRSPCSRHYSRSSATAWTPRRSHSCAASRRAAAREGCGAGSSTAFCGGPPFPRPAQPRSLP